MTILSDIKAALGIDKNNLGFDPEVLPLINAVAVILSHQGISEFDDLDITADTEWPTFQSPRIARLVPVYMGMKARSMFDPIASETVSQILKSSAEEFEGRIGLEVEEVEANA